MKRSLVIALVLVVGSACGGKSSTSESTTPTPGADHDEHGKMPPEVVKFHDVLSPRWHAEPGPDRMKDTCAAIPEMQAGADALVKSPMPAGAEMAKWDAGTKELVVAVAALEVTCDAPDATAFEPAFKHVHEVFHIVAEAVGNKENHGAPAPAHEHGTGPGEHEHH